MNLISGSGETSSRLPTFSLFLPGSCPNNRHRRTITLGSCQWRNRCRRPAEVLFGPRCLPFLPLPREEPPFARRATAICFRPAASTASDGPAYCRRRDTPRHSGRRSLTDEEITKATHGGVEGLIQYGAAINAFSIEQIEMLRGLDRAGLSQQAMVRALDLIDQHLPHSKDLLSDFGRSILQLKNSWDDLLTELFEDPPLPSNNQANFPSNQGAGLPTGQSVWRGGLARAISARGRVYSP